MKDLYHRQWASFGSVCVCGFVPLTRSTCLSTYVGLWKVWPADVIQRMANPLLHACIKTRLRLLYCTIYCSLNKAYTAALYHTWDCQMAHIDLHLHCQESFIKFVKKKMLCVLFMLHITILCHFGLLLWCGIIDSMHTFKPSSLFLCVRQL